MVLMSHSSGSDSNALPRNRTPTSLRCGRYGRGPKHEYQQRDKSEIVEGSAPLLMAHADGNGGWGAAAAFDLEEHGAAEEEGGGESE